MKITLVLDNLENNLHGIDVESPECIHILDKQGHVINTILAPSELDENAMHSKKILHDHLAADIKKFSNQGSAVRSIVIASLLPSIFLAQHYFHKIKSFCSSHADDSFEIEFKDSRAESRMPLSEICTGMSLLSIYILKKILAFGFESLWQDLNYGFAINSIPDGLNGGFPLYGLIEEFDLGSANSSGSAVTNSEDSSSCLVIGDGIRANYMKVLKDPSFYKPFIAGSIFSSFLICTEKTPVCYSRKRVYSPLTNLLFQIHDGKHIIKYLQSCVVYVLNRMRLLIKKFNVKMIIITDADPEKCLMIALSLTLASEMNLKVSIINHSTGPILFRTLNQSRGSKDFDLINHLSYGCAYYFVQARISWDPSLANLESFSRDISIIHMPQLNVLSSKSQENKSSNIRRIDKEKSKVLMISTQFYHNESSREYLGEILRMCKQVILQINKHVNDIDIYLRFRGDSILFVPPLMQSLFCYSESKAMKIYQSRSSNCISLGNDKSKIQIGFNGKNGTHSLLHRHNYLRHLHIGVSSSLMYESIEFNNKVIYLPTESNDFLHEHFYIKEQPYIANGLNDAFAELIKSL